MSATKKLIKGFSKFTEMYNRCPAEQLEKLKKFQQKHNEYLLKVNSLQETLPKIDWNYYKKNVRPDFIYVVENFEKIYKSLEIPYPEDKYSHEIDKETCELEEELRKFYEESNAKIKKYQKRINHIKSHPPFEEMTWEEFIDWYPELAPNFIERPTFWPHTPEEQICNNNESNDKDSRNDNNSSIKNI